MRQNNRNKDFVLLECFVPNKLGGHCAIAKAHLLAYSCVWDD